MKEINVIKFSAEGFDDWFQKMHCFCRILSYPNKFCW